MKRWQATVELDDGTTETFEFEEFSELEDLMKRGPDWNLIKAVYLRKKVGVAA
jgi:hypothetical protein